MYHNLKWSQIIEVSVRSNNDNDALCRLCCSSFEQLHVVLSVLQVVFDSSILFCRDWAASVTQAALVVRRIRSIPFCRSHHSIHFLSYICSGKQDIIIMSYKAGIVKAIQELKDRNGSSSIAIKKHMQAHLPKDKKWMNATFLASLKSGVASGEFVQHKNSYKLSADFKKKSAKVGKPKAATKSVFQAFCCSQEEEERCQGQDDKGQNHHCEEGKECEEVCYFQIDQGQKDDDKEDRQETDQSNQGEESNEIQGDEVNSSSLFLFSNKRQNTTGSFRIHPVYEDSSFFLFLYRPPHSLLYHSLTLKLLHL